MRTIADRRDEAVHRLRSGERAWMAENADYERTMSVLRSECKHLRVVSEVSQAGADWCCKDCGLIQDEKFGTEG